MQDHSEPPLSTDALRRESQALWDQKASYWDERFGEGNDFHRLLIEPSAERLLAIEPDQWVLDAACGNGAFSRRLAALGARVVACDVSPVFIERARQRSGERADRIQYHVVDLTEEGALQALGAGRFDAAVVNMALMDLPILEPLAPALAKVLKPGGRFVFTVQHPCFNSPGVEMMAETEQRNGRGHVVHSLKVKRYLDVPAQTGVGMVGEPNPHYYFHRPQSELLAPFLAAGFALDGLEEPAFPPADQPRPLSWESYSQIPPVLAVRMRLREP